MLTYQSIIATHRAFRASTDYQAIYRSILDSTIDAAETIVQCSKHMKTIVDGTLPGEGEPLIDQLRLLADNLSDVLTMSKLDSGLFIMTPVEVQVESIARDAVKMFEGEAKSHGIKLELHIEDSCRQSDINSVSLDPTRVLQILIVCRTTCWLSTLTNSSESSHQRDQIYTSRKEAPHFSQPRPCS